MKLNKTDFDRLIFNKYFMMTTSTKVTNSSPKMTKLVHLCIKNGIINHNIGSVIVDAKIHVKIIFQFFKLSFFKNNLHIKNNIIVSKNIVNSRDSIN